MKRLSAAIPVFPLLFSVCSAHAANQAEGSPVGDLLRVIFGLLAVLALMAGTFWLLKRVGVAKAASGSTVRVVGGVSVGNRERVLVVEVADQWIVVGVAPGQVTSLAVMPRQETVTPTDTGTQAPNFSMWLKKTMDKRNAG